MRNSATITIELAAPAEIGRFVWCADYLGGLKTRIDATLPSDYRVEVSSDGKTWNQVASSRDRLPFPEKDREDFLLRSVLSADEQAQWRDLAATGAKLKQQIADVPALPAAYIGKFQEPKDPIHLLKGGSVANPGDPVAPASLSTLAAVLPGFELALDAPEAQRRTALARWIVDARNPLTPRVLANRIWHYHFGRGLVGTPSDFGFNGELPTHSELLDYLARRLLELNWKMKPLHREIMLSAAYRQAGAPVEANLAIDADSQYLWRFPPQRLEAEEIRDAVLAVSGALDRKMGGPSFRLYRYAVDNVANYAPLDVYPPESFRRSVYHENPRSLRVEVLGAFDCPDPSLPEPRRGVTTSPLQALDLLNGPFMTGQAHLLAERLKREFGGSAKLEAAGAFRLALAREASDKELAAAVELIGRHGLELFCLTLFNSNEFIYVM